jgi:putative oxygen-independent coproporphyrinogen III oxidase
VENLSLYLHIPFCRHKCSYCDFNTYAGLDGLVSDYVRALSREIELFLAAAGERLPVHSIFFGGGTPSLLSLPELGEIFEILRKVFRFQPDTEITLEANPGTLTLDYIRGLLSLGVNRLSLGMQSAVPEDLTLLERQHSYFDVIQAVTWARRAGFQNLNLDLIFGLPYQSLDSWQNSLNLALGLAPDHFSLYALTLEHGTPLHGWVERGLVTAPDADLAADMYEWAGLRLEEEGFFQYEISNWASKSRTGMLRACRHNLQYWRNQPYIGLGAGAHGFIGGVRTSNVLSPAAYIERCLHGKPREFPLTPATLGMITIDAHMEMQETLLMGLRLTQEGVSFDGFQKRFGQSIQDAFRYELGRLLDKGLLECAGPNGDILRITPRGRLLGNQVFMEFV